MLEGYVTPSGEPVVPLRLVFHQRPTQCLAVIDTGFNGTETFEIANGAIVEQSIFLGEIIFDGKRQPTHVVATDARDILIGTKLLTRRTLTINFRIQRVTIK